MERNGYPEETYYTFSYSPVPKDEGGTGGIICANTDDTQRVIGERQLALLRDLAAGTADARSWRQACERSAAALATNPRDLPFAMIYMAEPDGRSLSLVGAAGIEPGHAAAPASVPLDGPSPWPFAEVLRHPEMRLVPDLAARFGGGPPTGSAWPRPPAQAAMLPISVAGATGRAGVLVVGLNPFRLFDEGYRQIPRPGGRPDHRGHRQRGRVRGRAPACRGAGGGRPGQDGVLLERQPRVPNAPHADAGPA